MSRQIKACRDNEKQIFSELHNSQQFFFIKQHSKLGAFIHTNLNILVKYIKSSKNLNSSMNNHNSLSSLNIIQKMIFRLYIKKKENNKATIHFLL